MGITQVDEASRKKVELFLLSVMDSGSGGDRPI